MTAHVRPAQPADVPDLVRLIYGLAEFERMPQQCTVTAEQIAHALFRPGAAVFGHVAGQDGAVVGMALWFLTFSTWDGVHGIHLEDLFVEPEQRGRGHGRRLLASLAEVCVERGYTRLEWEVLDWNSEAIGFYESIGADGRGDWTNYRLTGRPLAVLAGTAEDSSAAP